MNKKVLILAVALVALLTMGVTGGCGGSEKGKIEYVAHNSKALEISNPDGIDIYIDASGSMKGYVDGVVGTFKTNVPDLTVNPTNKEAFYMPEDSIKCYTINNKSLVLHNTLDFCNNVRNKTLFNGGSTLLHDMFDVVVKRQINAPSRVSVIISDCILSFSGAEINQNPDVNKQNIGILESNVTRSMTKLVNNNLSVAIIQYKSDFNGNYYYNYQNRPLPAARNQTLTRRPYYFILIGQREKIDAMFNKNVLPKGYDGVYMFNNETVKPKFTVIRPQKSGAVIVEDNKPHIKVNQKGPNAPYFYVAVEDFVVPSYLENSLEKIMQTPLIKGNAISSVEKVDFNVVNEDKILKKNDVVTAAYLYKVILKANEQLRDISDVTDELRFKSEGFDAKKSEIEDDNVADVTELEDKTFMFSHFIKAIEKAYLNSESVVACVPLHIEKIVNK